MALIGKRLPQDVGIFWTGSSVKTGQKTKESTEWFTNLIQRKPFFFQNGVGAKHIHYFHYVTDSLPEWRDWAYDGFYQDLDTYMLNVGLPGDCAKLATMSDYLWNPTAYDPAQSVEQAVAYWTSMSFYVAAQKTFIEEVRKNPQLSAFTRQAEDSKQMAAKEIPLVEATDTFLSASEFLGGAPPTLYGYKQDERPRLRNRNSVASCSVRGRIRGDW